MWIVKLGGSLARDPLLYEWLQTLAGNGGRVVVVPGGGGFADQVREHQAQWAFDDLVAHNMALLAMVQYGLMIQGICPALTMAGDEAAIRRVLDVGGVPVWAPLALLRTQPDELTHWGVSSDSLAAWLANRIDAQGLALVKSCEIEPGLSFEQYEQEGVVDSCFARFTQRARYRVELLHKEDTELMQALLCQPML